MANNKYIRAILLLLSAAIYLYQPAYSQDDSDTPSLLTNVSASMLANTCSGCHGPGGRSLGPATPTISGMSPTFFIKQMEGYKSGKLPSTIMKRIVDGYTSAEIKQMAEFFSKQPFIAAKGQQSDKKLIPIGKKLHKKYCEKCHSKGGQSVEDDTGILTGQWKSYLEVSMQDYISGERKATKKMQHKVENLMKKEGINGVRALIDYYARPLLEKQEG